MKPKRQGIGIETTGVFWSILRLAATRGLAEAASRSWLELSLFEQIRCSASLGGARQWQGLSLLCTNFRSGARDWADRVGGLLLTTRPAEGLAVTVTTPVTVLGTSCQPE